MRDRKFVSNNSIIFLIFLLSIILIGYLVLNSYNDYLLENHNYKAEVFDIMGQRINSLVLEINDFPRDEGDDILYLGKLVNLRRFINSREDNQFRDLVKEDFLSFMKINKVYYQLRYIDETGKEIIRIENDGENFFIIEDKNLQNKSDRYYFQEAMLLKEGDVYISELDLNIENGVLENRGTVENPEYIPIIRYALPLFDDFENRKGIIILNVYADYFLEDIRGFAKEGEIFFLIDPEGYYLAHPNRSKEFSFMFDSVENFFNDYADSARTVFYDLDSRTHENENYIFTFRKLYPTVGTFEMYKGAEKIFGKNSEEEYYWVLVSVSDKKFLEQSISSIRLRFFIFALFSASLVILILILLSFLLISSSKAE